MKSIGLLALSKVPALGIADHLQKQNQTWCLFKFIQREAVSITVLSISAIPRIYTSISSHTCRLCDDHLFWDSDNGRGCLCLKIAFHLGDHLWKHGLNQSTNPLRNRASQIQRCHECYPSRRDWMIGAIRVNALKDPGRDM